ncbi:MAG TPA: rhodanese-like domain-containing protein [Actinomycetota bacterium]|nr:rhodanese-like domain-containing protein [Actinomycetota bacterium]
MQAELTTPRGVYERLGDVTVVDVREPYEWVAGRIDGAVHIPLNQLMSGAGADLDKGRPMVMVCRVGNRSELATLMMQARGYEAYNLEGGMDAWAREGLPFEAEDGSPGTVA